MIILKTHCLFSSFVILYRNLTDNLSLLPTFLYDEFFYGNLSVIFKIVMPLYSYSYYMVIHIMSSSDKLLNCVDNQNIYIYI